MKKKLFFVLLSLIACLLLTSCEEAVNTDTNSEMENINTELQKLQSENQSVKLELQEIKSKYQSVTSELEQQIKENDKLKKELAQYKQTASRNGLHYRDDIIMIINMLEETGSGFKFPIFNEDIPESHRTVLNDYLNNYKYTTINDSSITKEIEPIFQVFSVEKISDEELIWTTRENCYYYQVIFYQSLIPEHNYQENKDIIRGPFDGLIFWYVIEIEDTEGVYRVSNFGSNS